MLLALDQLDRVRGAIAQEIGAGIAGRLLDRRLAQAGHAVLRGAGEAGQRHLVRLDDLALRLPFARQRLGERGRGQSERLPGRRAQRAAVEQHAVGGARGRDLDPLIEALHAAAPTSSSRSSKRSRMVAAPAAVSDLDRMIAPGDADRPDAGGVRHGHVVAGVAHHQRLAGIAAGLAHRRLEHARMRLAGVAVGGLQAREQRAQPVMGEDAVEARPPLAGRHPEQMPAPVELAQRRERPGIERLVQAAQPQRPPGGAVALDQAGAQSGAAPRAAAP